MHYNTALEGFDPVVELLETIGARGRPAYGLATKMAKGVGFLSVREWTKVIQAAALVGLLEYQGERAGRFYRLSECGKAYMNIAAGIRDRTWQRPALDRDSL